MTVLSLVLVGVWLSQSNSESNNHGNAQWEAVVDCLIVWLLSPGDNYVVRKQMLPLFWITAGSKKVSKPTMIAVHPLRPILTHNPVPFYSKVIKPDKSPNHLVCFPLSLQNTARKDCVPSETETVDLTVMEVMSRNRNTSLRKQAPVFGAVSTQVAVTTQFRKY